MMPKLGDLEIMWIQLIGFLGTILFFVSFQCKNKKNMFKVFIIFILYDTFISTWSIYWWN